MLIVIESPNKSKKIQSVTKAQVVATVGHFKDLPKKKMGVDLTTYEPSFVLNARGRKVSAQLKKAAQNEKVYIATDPDREGYAIGYMAYEVIKEFADKVYRLEIREVTEKGIKEAFDHAIPFETSNVGLFSAFLGRRVGDRVVGYLLSPAASSDMRGRFSVGRVQSPAVRLVAEREREIRNFKPEPYWRISVLLDKEKQQFAAFHTTDKFFDQAAAERVFALAREADQAVTTNVTKKVARQHPKPPFTTANLQATANSQLRLAPEWAMKLAQDMFERGLITYHRTDSVRFNDDFIKDIRSFVTKEYGKTYIPAKPKVHKSKNTQADAHEGIRPTRVHALSEIPALLSAEGLNEEHQKLYELICKRAYASQMASATFDATTLEFDVKGEPFKATGRVMKFEGFLALYKETVAEDDKDENDTREEDKEQSLPSLSKGEAVAKIGEKMEEKVTKPPPRFSEGRLVKELEKRGIGRPSTYATIMRTLKTRDYVRKQKGRLMATSKAERLVDYLSQHHPWIIDYDMTRNMEEYLDQVEEGAADWQGFVRDMHTKIKERLAILSGEPEGEVDPNMPTRKQLEYAKDLAAKLGQELPEEAVESRKSISGYIKKARKDALKITPLSEKQMGIVEKHGDEELQQKVTAGDYDAGRKFINDFFKQGRAARARSSRTPRNDEE